jgi:outer membrane protein assembly factor BamD
MDILPALVLATSLLLAGCASSPDELDDPQKWSVEKLFKEAKTALDAEDYEVAIEHFEILESKYPFGPYAEQAQLDTAYAYFKFEEAESAIAAADRFIKLHPRHPKVDYAYYLRGLANESQKDNPLDAVLPQDLSRRDPKSTRESYEYYVTLVKKFPQSRYAQDAIQRMNYLRNQLATYEIHVADYYMQRSAYVAAVNRAKYVVQNYPRTPSAREALRILMDGYKQLGLDDLAQDAQRVLELNSTTTPNTSSGYTDEFSGPGKRLATRRVRRE